MTSLEAWQSDGSDTGNQLIVRPAWIEDAPAMAAIRAGRQADIVPSDDPAYTTERAAWWRGEEGIQRRRSFAEAMAAHPDRYFAWSATYGKDKELVGYAGMEAPPEDPYTYWRGMNIARGYDGMGIGRRLEAKRQARAREIGRPVRVLVVVGNSRSLDFFQLQGFTYVATQEPTAIQPLRFNVLELGLAALSGTL